MKNQNNDAKTVRRTLDTGKPVKLTSEQQARLSTLAQRPDSEIDFSDLPPLTSDQLARMVRANPNYKPTKTPTTFRLDSDVVAWLKSGGKGWQTRTNDLLRQMMLTGLTPSEQELQDFLRAIRALPRGSTDTVPTRQAI